MSALRWLADRRHLLLVLALAGFHMLVWERGLAGDGWGYFSNMESMIEDRDLDLTNNRYAVTNGISYHEKTQKWVAHYPPGLALFDAPFYLAGKLAYERGWFRPRIPEAKVRTAYRNVDSATLARITFIVLGHNLYSLLALVLIDGALRRLGFTPGLSALVTGLAFFAGPMHFFAQNGMAHAVGFFCAATSSYVLAGICAAPGGSPWRWFRLGLAMGVGAIVRYPCALFSAAAGIALIGLYGPFGARSSIEVGSRAYGARDLRHRSPGKLIARGLLFSAGLLSLLWILPVYLKLQGGEWFASTYTPHWVFNPWNPPVWNVLLNPKHGFLWYHPLYVIVIGALVAAAVSSRMAGGSHRRVFAGAALAALVAIATVHGFWFSWWADSYSNRYVSETIPFLAPGLAIFLGTYGAGSSIEVGSRANGARDLRSRGHFARRLALAIFLTLLSYCFFLLSNAGLAYDIAENGPGQRLSDYRYILDYGLGFGDVLKRIRNASFTLPALARHAGLVAGAFLLLFAFWAWLGRVADRKGAPRTRPAEGHA
jgi:hypothetical protein